MYGPYAQQPRKLELHRASPGLIGGGAVLALVGTIAIAGGGFWYLSETGIVCDGGIDGSGSCGGSGARGVALMVGGLLGVIGGVTMIVLGARKVSTPGSQATLQLRPTGADLRVTF
jgi:hypothetical protein